ncbi:MAG: desulfoferrodoxin family protein [Bacteroidota bacterium]
MHLLKELPAIFPSIDVHRIRYISWVQLWDGEKMLAQTTLSAGTMGNAPSQVEVDLYIVPTKSMKLMAHAFCTKHGLWQSNEVAVEVAE